MEIVDLDAEGFAAARAHAEAIDWLPDDGSMADRQDGYRQLGEILLAYLNALPKPEQGRDRIAVVVSRHGVGNAWILDPEQDRVMSASSWDEMEAEMQDDDGCCEPGFNPPFARAIIHCNLPRPAEPSEVEGSVEGVS